MAYTDAAKVKSMFRDFSSSTTPAVTDGEITAFIAEHDAVIDGSLKGVYAIPITGTKSLKIIEKISRNLTAGVVDEILNSYGEADKKPEYEKRGKRLLSKLKPKFEKGVWLNPEMFLPDNDFLGLPDNPNKSARIKVASTTGRQFVKGGDNW